MKTRTDKQITKARIRYKTTGSTTVTVSKSTSQLAYEWNNYLKGMMKNLQNSARQFVFRNKPPRKPCFICGECDVSAFFLDYLKPEWIWLCQSHHKSESHNRGSIYDQLVRHSLKPISWEDWKAGARPEKKVKK